MAVAKPKVEETPTEDIAGIERSLNIVEIISKISNEAGALAPSKADGGGVPFKFRGIDSTINHLAPLLQKYGVVTTPRVIQFNVEHIDSGNRQITWTDVVVDYTFTAPDGTSINAVTPGLASDFADRSAAQAMSVAFRIALLQTFTLPTDSPEPEVTGQAVLDAADGKSAPPTRAQQSIAKAATVVDPLDAARLAVRKAGAAKGLTPSQINEVGQKIDEDFFSKVESLEKVRAAIEAGE